MRRGWVPVAPTEVAAGDGGFHCGLQMFPRRRVRKHGFDGGVLVLQEVRSSPGADVDYASAIRVDEGQKRIRHALDAVQVGVKDAFGGAGGTGLRMMIY